MEDSMEMHSEENKVSSEKNLKRRYKTRAQVFALEEFYNEHKYPDEEMKMKLAEQIGLTEKQVSGWFCHRRLKEKRLLSDEALVSGRQDRSSGVVQDRGSGLRQDSCGSTKQGDIRNIDPREVESRRLYGHDFHSSELAYDHRSQYTGHISGRERDDTSSESSSFLQDRLYSRSEDPYSMESSRFLGQNGTITPINLSTGKSKEYRPSGYLKVKGESENAAITAVKMQLGRHYREDGPPLGVEFEPLPPGAFESPGGDPVNEPLYVGNSRWPQSLDVPGIEKQNTLGTVSTTLSTVCGLSDAFSALASQIRYEEHGSKLDFQDLCVEGESVNNMRRSDFQGVKSHHQLKKKSTLLHYSNLSPGENSALDVYEDSAGEMPIYNSNQGYILSSKQDTEGMRIESALNHHDLHSGRTTSERIKPLLHDYDNVSPRIAQKSDYLSKSSNLAFRTGKSLDAKERRPSKRMAKVEKLYGERKAIKEHHDPGTVKIIPTDEINVAKQLKVGFPQRDYVAKASYAEIPRWKNQIKRSAADMPSSFSEDETAETSSSMD